MNRGQLPKLPGDLDLIESLTALRQGRYLKAVQKVLLILDLFEQWLHAKRSAENAELVQALRQCDGGRSMIYDTAVLAETRKSVAGELQLLLSADEEGGSAFGVKYLASAGYMRGDEASIGEASGVRRELEFIDRASRCICFFALRCMAIRCTGA